ncbi:Type I phosphodiesterase / nucleotide pyrophosphatase [Anatilimnocola aggregata]|uniref:Type I phosphodiesterase / nucleotide pyrophosphatase n=1 Tax=Anatilimnocola aggregata TaxID=2528021 RepID=A0A517YNX3_9BACT|nr:nucleotide pyrophosphatase/phosphodiesterase family protein [Anatilimnocola aggregata]QDU31913.1 Type I phosphodiesterase / nucleotide pyrophosphatase [Anatilimnocola aggregata]
MPPPLVLILAVGLTKKLLGGARRLNELAAKGWTRELREIVPAVTCSAQATILTGVQPEQHGVVGNGWLYRETQEVRFWQQSNSLIQAEPLYATARKAAEARGEKFRAAKLFWQFNQGSDCELSVTPKPYYGADGSKAFGITGTPDGLSARLEKKLGAFPFPAFWGPMAGLPSSAWIAQAAAEVLTSERPDLSLVYLPHLDYDPQRFGPSGSDMPRLVRELDDACEPLLDAAKRAGARVWVVSEYGLVDVQQPLLINRKLREAGLLAVRPGPFGEILETFLSRAFAVVDHQVAHIYVKHAADLTRTRELVAALPGVAKVYAGEERAAIGLNHPRAGELVAMANSDSWFAYPFWLDERHEPDYARTIDIHRKPGYDPCEMLFDPKLIWPKGRAAFRLAQKKLGFRALFDIVPVDPGLIRGSHGLPTADHRPILIGDGPDPGQDLALTAVRDLVLRELGARG